MDLRRRMSRVKCGDRHLLTVFQPTYIRLVPAISVFATIYAAMRHDPIFGIGCGGHGGGVAQLVRAAES
jgi:hypothetical protein